MKSLKSKGNMISERAHETGALQARRQRAGLKPHLPGLPGLPGLPAQRRHVTLKIVPD
jgi:hypothetical protein